MDGTLILLGAGALTAGFVDAVVGGGGLIQVPALLAAFPAQMPATLFGTNKLASIVGTASAAMQYARRIQIPWGVAGPAALMALPAAWFGAKAVYLLPPATMRPLILVLLALVAIYTFKKKDFGLAAGTAPIGMCSPALGAAIGGAVGFYDGFFGPGTGSFLIFLFVRLIRMDFLRASVCAKIVNASTNLAAIAYFSAHGAVLWEVAGVMAACNLVGAQVGSYLALRNGSFFVRRFFLGVVVLLIGRLLLDQLSFT